MHSFSEEREISPFLQERCAAGFFRMWENCFELF